MPVLAFAIGANPPILVFEHLEQDGIAEVFIGKLPANQIDESVFVSSGFERSLDMENKASSLICLVLCAFWPAHRGI